MTEAEVAAIKTSQIYYHYVQPKEHEKERDEAWDRMIEARKNCDHKYPDGKNAILSSLFCSVCDICGETDF